MCGHPKNCPYKTGIKRRWLKETFLFIINSIVF